MVSAWLRDPATGEPVDQVMVCAMKAPRSYTGEDVVEVYGHGGELNMDRVLSLLSGLGARLAQPGEFTRRAFLNGRLDLTQAEAVAQVIAARSEQAVRNAVVTLAGALGDRVNQLRQQLLVITARLEARIDFAEEVDDPELDSDLDTGLLSAHQEVAQQVRTLAHSYTTGRQLDGVVVALVGPVNAGKSSLFNRLLENTRALVSEEPGTTRDYLEAEVYWEGRRVVLVDTAGSRHGSAPTPLELAGQELADQVVARCDLLVNVVDLSDPRCSRGLLLFEKKRPVVVAANKQDLCPADALDLLREQSRNRAGALPHAVVGTSALQGDGIDELREQILMGLGLDDEAGQWETVMVTHQRQHAALCAAQEALEAGAQAQEEGLPPELVVEHYRDALGALGEITGETYTEHVLDAVFETFCIGK